MASFMISRHEQLDHRHHNQWRCRIRQNNPAGADAAVIYNQTNVVWQPNVIPFASTATNPVAAPQVGAFGVNQNFKMPRASVVSFNVEQQVSRKTLLSVGYVGSFGQHLEVLYDINQPVASGTTTPNARPYQQTSFTNENPAFTGKPLLAINQLNFEAASNFHSLQVTSNRPPGRVFRPPSTTPSASHSTMPPATPRR